MQPAFSPLAELKVISINSPSKLLPRVFLYFISQLELKMASDESCRLLRYSENTADVNDLTERDKSTKIQILYGNATKMVSELASSCSNHDMSLSGYVEIGENCEVPRKSWKIGLLMAFLSGTLFTVNNFFIQYFEVNAIEMLLVRSGLQSVVLGAIIITYSNCQVEENIYLSTRAIRIWMGLQALFGAIRLFLNFACLEYLSLIHI